MTERLVIRARDPSVPPSGGSGLPRDLLEQSAGRLGIAAVLFGTTYSALYGLGLLTGRYVRFGPGMILSFHVLAGVLVLASAAVLYIARAKRLSPERISDVGLGYEVLTALGMSVPWAYVPVPAGTWLGMSSWLAVWIVVFPLLVPNSPGKTLLAALAAASTAPLMLLVGMARGSAHVSWTIFLTFSLPLYVCVAWAYIASRIIYKLGVDIVRARRLGSYELVELLGRGGMGEVWRAKHRLLARPAAVKLIKAGAMGGSPAVAVRRFEREAQATAALRSPHSITLFDYGVTEEGTLYYVMEFLRGLDLRSLVKRSGPLPPERTVFFLKQICHSLEDAHARGLIHRDIKPENIYMCRLGSDFDFIKVLDFGLVKTGDEAGGETLLTAEQALAGTAGYVSPEAAGGEAEARSDIYSLGCVAYWMLTGGEVFKADSAMAVVMKHVRQAPVPPSRRVDTPIPAALDRLVLACLEKEPSRRPQTMAELSAGLDECGIDEAWTRGRAREWWRGNLPDLAGSNEASGPS